jgi:hypothetical protein
VDLRSLDMTKKTTIQMLTTATTMVTSMANNSNSRISRKVTDSTTMNEKLKLDV